MTESEYLACADPARLLEWLRGNHPFLPPCPAPPPSDRKLRLFACACRERAVESLAAGWVEAYGSEGEKIRDSPGMARAWANGNATDGDLTQALKASLLRDVVGNPFRPLDGGRPVRDERVCEKCGHRSARHPGKCTACGSDHVRKWRVRDTWGWLTPAVLGIARRAYDLRDWEALPVLADALQEAGCEDEQVLGHLRGPGPHVRGCFAVDALLGKG
jgi:ribosomal protein L37E